MARHRCAQFRSAHLVVSNSSKEIAVLSGVPAVEQNLMHGPCVVFLQENESSASRKEWAAKHLDQCFQAQALQQSRSLAHSR